MADHGHGSRRSCESLVIEGRVSIDGEVCTSLSRRIADGERVEVDGKACSTAPATVTLLLYKPAGILCTRDDPGGRQTIFDLLPGHLRQLRKLHYAGRLDRDSEGLIVLSNDGDLTQRLTHPGRKVEKEYVVNLAQPFRDADAERLLGGIQIEGGLARATGVERVSKRTVAITLEQGMKRQLRLMLGALGYTVKRLVRVRIGGLEDPGLKPGAWRLLGRRDLSALFGQISV